MSENIYELLNNDDFIAWVTSDYKINNKYWNGYRNDLTKANKDIFNEAIRILIKIKALHLDDAKSELSSEFIQEQYIRLLEATSRPKHKERSKSRFFQFNNLLKYAALLVIIIGLSGFFFLLNNKNTFKKHLVATEFNSNEILLQTSKNEFYKITETTNNKWLTNHGEFVSVDSDNISFVASDNISKGEEKYTIYVPAGKKFHLTLVDGTEVELNSNSTITFNNSITSKKRYINFTGEAFFDVAHNEERPFIVQSSEAIIEVLGTEFNISNYKENGYICATLVDGSIKISNSQGKSQIIKPGEQAKLFHNQNKVIVQSVDVQEVVAWTSGRMIFRNETLENLIPKMNRWFDVEFVILDENLKDYRFNGTLKKENDLTHYLQILKYTEGISYKIENKQVKLFINED